MERDKGKDAETLFHLYFLKKLSLRKLCFVIFIFVMMFCISNHKNAL